MLCRVCGGPTEFFDKAMVLNKYLVQYFRCTKCQFIQTEEPYWLDEAYSAAIAARDVGIMQRNIVNRNVVANLLRFLYSPNVNCLDFGGGHGIFVRLMRDEGYDFRWHDRYASNDYARGFQHASGHYDFATAFEVIEHLPDPLHDLSELMSLADDVLVSTELVPPHQPKVSDWWYFYPPAGQHVAFYTKRSLQVIAEKFGRHLQSRGSYHLFSKRPLNRLVFDVATSYKLSKLMNFVSRRTGLVEKDFETLTQ